MHDIKLAFVVAIAENGVIGRDGHLPWHLPSDLKRFRKITLGKPIIMGRKTFQSLKKPLDGRTNIIVTYQTGFEAAGAIVMLTTDDAIHYARGIAQRDGVCEIMVIGGAQIYLSLLDKADRIYLTRVHGKPEGDTYFPDLKREHWSETACEKLTRGERDDYEATLHIFDRKGSTAG